MYFQQGLISLLEEQYISLKNHNFQVSYETKKYLQDFLTTFIPVYGPR